MRIEDRPVEGTKERTLGWFIHGWHNYDSFLPGMNWRNFTFLKIEGEWNHMTGRWELDLALLGFGVTIMVTRHRCALPS